MSKRQSAALAIAMLAGVAAGSRAEGIVVSGPPGTGASSEAPRPGLTPSKDLEKALARKIYDWASRTPEKLQEKIREVLVTYIENPETVEIEFQRGSALQTMAGRFPRIEISMLGTIIKGLRVDRGYIVLENSVLDLPKLLRDGKFRFREKGRTDFLFEVSEAALNSLLVAKGDKLDVDDARMRLEYGHLTFTGRMKVLFFNNHVTVHGRFRPRRGTEVHFDPHHLRLDFLPLPGFVMRMIRDRINPVADLENFRFDVDIGAIETTKTRIMLCSRGFEEYVSQQIRIEKAGLVPRERTWPPPGHSELLLSRGERVEAAMDRFRAIKRASERDDHEP